MSKSRIDRTIADLEAQIAEHEAQAAALRKAIEALLRTKHAPAGKPVGSLLQPTADSGD